MAWGKNGTPDTLTSAGVPDITDLGGLKFNQFMIYTIPNTGNDLAPRINGDATASYAVRISNNGGSDATYVSQNEMLAFQSVPNENFCICYAIGILSEEKLFIAHHVMQNTAGAGNAPTRRETVSKWDNTSNTIDRFQAYNPDASGDFASDSNLSALGSDLTPAAAVVFPTNVQVGSRAEITDTRKIYYRDDVSWKEIGQALELRKDSWYEHITGETP